MVNKLHICKECQANNFVLKFEKISFIILQLRNLKGFAYKTLMLFKF